MTAGLAGAWAVVLPADAAAIPGLWQELAGECRRLRVDAARTEAIRLCAEEIATNIVRHAYAGRPAGEMRVRLAVRGDGAVVLAFEDEGAPFDPTAHVEAPVPGRAEDLDLGGLGIRLVRGFAQDMRYERVGSTNRLALVFAGG
ncbi:hypothetical protein STVA_07650 [Allostella vacuolata]|nr:hypothetical protein STVA_07650 [Stella vacuolata]